MLIPPDRHPASPGADQRRRRGRIRGAHPAACDGRYSPRLMAVTLVGFGTAGTAFGTMVTASGGVADRDQGVVGGFVNTSRQVGAAFGAALLPAVAQLASHGGRSAGPAGDRAAMLAGAVAAVLAMVVALCGGRAANGSGGDEPEARPHQNMLAVRLRPGRSGTDLLARASAALGRVATTGGRAGGPAHKRGRDSSPARRVGSGLGGPAADGGARSRVVGSASAGGCGAGHGRCALDRVGVSKRYQRESAKREGRDAHDHDAEAREESDLLHGSGQVSAHRENPARAACWSTAGPAHCRPRTTRRWLPRATRQAAPSAGTCWRAG